MSWFVKCVLASALGLAIATPLVLARGGHSAAGGHSSGGGRSSGAGHSSGGAGHWSGGHPSTSSGRNWSGSGGHSSTGATSRQGSGQKAVSGAIGKTAVTGNSKTSGTGSTGHTGIKAVGARSTTGSTGKSSNTGSSAYGSTGSLGKTGHNSGKTSSTAATSNQSGSRGGSGQAASGSSGKSGNKSNLNHPNASSTGTTAGKGGSSMGGSSASPAAGKGGPAHAGGNAVGHGKHSLSARNKARVATLRAKLNHKGHHHHHHLLNALNKLCAGGVLCAVECEAIVTCCGDPGCGLTNDERGFLCECAEACTPDDASNDSAGSAVLPKQVERYLRVTNKTQNKLTIWVQFRTPDDAGSWTWLPADPAASDQAAQFEVDAGATTYLDYRGQSIKASRVRITALSGDGGKWNEYGEKDLWLVPEVDGDGWHCYFDAELQTFDFSFGNSD